MDFVGGRGFGIHYLYREVTPETDPLGEHNKIIFVAGPLARGAPGEGQMMRNLDKFLDRYYELRGWTPQGIPSPEKLKELGLGYAIKDMAQYEKVKAA